MVKIVSVIGARPQFIKAAPLELAFAQSGKITHYSVHTGQHYNDNMSKIFFDELGLQKPYKNLNVGSGSHAVQTAGMVVGLEPIFLELQPDVVVVYGDTNSTIAAGLVAAKLNIPVAHIEAGLRSFNREMPEEINRILTDHLSTLLFAPTQAAVAQLAKEGIQHAINSGDIMLDMIRIAERKGILESNVAEDYCYVTLHRPYNTDSESRLLSILQTLNALPFKVVFSLHPRTENLLKNEYGVDLKNYVNIEFIEPQGYFENLKYLLSCKALITDSGGMQKEAYFLNKKCITIRSETEWTETQTNNCNTLIWENIQDIQLELDKPFGPFIEGIYGDGKSAKLITQGILGYLTNTE
ncbi:MAG: UDP-N-acetylglucosamine 2-epimerase (non-hydrolyzing) [Bacteroidia bacterium]|nr:UDP-N-acetylglucosamine 2-epimerase (non-hydrolyzing) [Bacteroidia bacterium]